MKKVFILGDGQGWIVDRIIDEMVARLSDRFEFIRRAYTNIATEELVNIANNSDLTHYGNWDFSRHLGAETRIVKPVLMSIRSHRYQPYVSELYKIFYTHVINPMLLMEFPNAAYIPDAVFDMYKPSHKFIVGMAFQEASREYKGYYLVKQACDELGIELKVVSDINPSDMLDFYNSIDLLVGASIAEGFGTPVMECLAMNKPVLTTNVGIATIINCHKCDRTVESIKNGIQKFYTSPQTQEYNWSNVCDQFANLYNKLI